MNLRDSLGRPAQNLGVIKNVLAEFSDDRTVLLDHACGSDFLKWSGDVNGKPHSMLVAIPQAWLNQADNAAKLAETTRNFATRIGDSNRRP
jgi:hypothetical protein